MGVARRINDMAASIAREAKLAGLPLPTMLYRVSQFYARTGLGPRYFIVAGMARSDFPAEDKWRHISARQYQQAVDFLNPALYRKFTQHKVAEKALYSALHVPTPALHGYFDSSEGIDNQGQPLGNPRELGTLLQNLAGRSICTKPVEGWGGSGVQLLTLPESAQACEQVAAKLLESYRDGEAIAPFVIEAAIDQAPQYSAFNPDSVNTIRAWVLDTGAGDIEVIGAYLRIGRQGMAVDNASAGGIMCPLELDSGRTRPGILKHTPHRAELQQHPDHGAGIAGVVLEDWQALKQTACDTLRKLPCTRFAGIDLAMASTGPVIVETNVLPDKDGAAHANIPSCKLLEAARRHGAAF